MQIQCICIAQATQESVVLFAFLILGVFFLLFAVFWFGFRTTSGKNSTSPYTGMPLRRATDLSYYSMEKVLRYLYELHQYDNRIFLFRKSALCRDTGRIFPNCITWYDTINVDWNFLQKRYPGKYVSWGSLTIEQQAHVRQLHDSLEGFQTEKSSPNPIPKAVEPEFALTKPGPLYVDVETHVLVGWKVIPDTELEVLIVQKPKPIPKKFTPIEEE